MRPLTLFALFFAVLVIASPSSSRKSLSPARIKQLDKLYFGSASPQMDLPPAYRQRNEAGSCVHATTVMLLRWVGLHDKADEWWSNYHNGEHAARHTDRLEVEGLTFAVTTDGDDDLLEYALATRRGMGVGDTPNHCRALVGRVEHGGRTCAVILDNNHIGKYIYEPWEEWHAGWKNQGGWGFVVLKGQVPPVTPAI